MTTKKTLLIYTETPLHIGCGKDIGAIDMPVARERISGQPIIPGSGLKGSLRHMVEFDLEKKDLANEIFGQESNEAGKTIPGALIFSEGRIVTFPLRAPKGCFALATSPNCLQRFARATGEALAPISVKENECLASLEKIGSNGKVVLEDYCFSNMGRIPEDVTALLSGKIDDPVYAMGLERIAILSDTDFSYFCENATEISTHNKIGENGVVEGGALFNIECVPSETLFQATILETGRNKTAMAKFESILKDHSFLQLGGKATTGRGICHIKLI